MGTYLLPRLVARPGNSVTNNIPSILWEQSKRILNFASRVERWEATMRQFNEEVQELLHVDLSSPGHSSARCSYPIDRPRGRRVQDTRQDTAHTFGRPQPFPGRPVLALFAIRPIHRRNSVGRELPLSSRCETTPANPRKTPTPTSPGPPQPTITPTFRTTNKMQTASPMPGAIFFQ
jgi:hypothetical protein